MKDIIEALFEYARIGDMESRNLRQIPNYAGYNVSVDRLEPYLEALKASLSPEQMAMLERYMETEQKVDWFTERALFRCGLAMGLKLSGLMLS